MSRFLKGIRGIAFDAVGTLIFPNPGAAVVYAETARRYGLEFDPAKLGSVLWSHFRIEDDLDRQANWITSEVRERERWSRIVTAALPGASEALFEELFAHFSLSTAWMVPPAAAEVLAELNRRGFVLALASNYDSRLTSVVAGIPALAPVRDRVVISSLVGVRKPGRDFFTRGVLPALEMEPSEILFVGDDLENDYEGARSVGIRAVLLDAKNQQHQVTDRIVEIGELLG